MAEHGWRASANDGWVHVEMVRRLFPSAVFGAISLLSSCGLFTASLFPSYLSQVEASAELSEPIDALLNGRTNRLWTDLFVLRDTAGKEFPALLLFIEYSPDRSLYIMDSQFQPKILTYNGLDSLHVTDASGDFVVGQIIINSSTLSFKRADSNILGSTHGFSDGANNYLLWIDGALPDQLQCKVFLPGWTTSGSFSALWGSSSVELKKVYYDPARTGQEVILVLWDWGANQAVLAFTPAADYALFALPTILISFPSVRIGNVKPEPLHYTRKGIMAHDYEGNTVLYDFDGVTVKGKLRSDYRKETQEGYDLEGDYFFLYNVEDRILYKGKTGW